MTEDLREDAKLLITSIERVHLGLWRYLSKQEWAEATASFRAAYTQSRTYADAWLAVVRLISAIRCDHTNTIYNQ